MGSNQDNINDNSTKSKNKNNFNDLIEKSRVADINITYYIDYFTYKKQLIKNMTDDINMITDFFDDKITDILFNIMILKKKKKINEDEFKKFVPIYDFIYSLHELNFFDQEDFLNLSIKLFGIVTIIDDINTFSKKFKFSGIINIEELANNFLTLFDKLCKKNILFDTFEILSRQNSSSNSHSKLFFTSKLKIFAKKISVDYFMYYNSYNIYNKIINNLFEQISTITNNNAHINLAHTFKKYKEIFTEEYDYYCKKHNDIYSSQEVELKLKFKLKKKENISKLVEYLNFISGFD